MYCKKCGKTVDPHAKFCSNCGAEITEEKISFDFDRPSKHIEPEKKKIHVTKENFKWDLDGFPSENKGGTEEVEFNWDSVIETKRRNSAVMDEPISFTEKKDEPEKAEEIEIEPVPEKYELTDLFGEDMEEKKEEEAVNDEDDEIMELSFEDEIFGDLKDEKPASATIRISQTIHFTDQLYSFDSKQAEYQSMLDAEYDRLQEEEDEEDMQKPEIPELQENKTLGDFKEGEPEIRTGIASDDFLIELYGTTNPEEEKEAEAAVEESEDSEAEKNEVAEEIQYETETEKETEVIEKEEITEEETIEENKSEEAEEAEETEETESEEDTEIPDVNEQYEEEEEEVICQESVPADGMECVGVALARTPRGVLVIQKNNKEKLTRRTIFPSKEAEESEEKENTEDEKNSRTDERQAEKERNEKLSFGDVFNNADDDDDDNEDYKPKKKGRALRIIAVILFIAILAELAFIGIQHFAPESGIAKQLNLIYSRVIEKIIPGDEPEVIEEDDLVVTSPVNDYVVAKDGKYSNIARISTDIELKFPENKTYELKGFDESGTFKDEEWFKDDNGNSVTYGQAVVESVCGFYNALTDYRNSANEDVKNLITENSPIAENIGEIESGEEIYAVNRLVIGEIRTSASGIYVAVEVEETNNKAEKPEKNNFVIYLRPVEHELKVDNVVYL